MEVPYGGYFSRGDIFVKVVILAISWKKFRGFGRAHAVCAFSCANISWFASRPRKPRKYYPSKNTRYTVFYACILNPFCHIFSPLPIYRYGKRVSQRQ